MPTRDKQIWRHKKTLKRDKNLRLFCQQINSPEILLQPITKQKQKSET